VGIAGRVVLFATALGAALLVAPTGLGRAFWVLVPPVAALGVVGGLRGTADAVALPRLLALAAGFTLVGGVLLAPPLFVLGPRAFAREVLLVGAGVAGIYERTLPAAAVAAAAVGAVGFAAPRARGGPLLALGALVLAAPLAREVVAGVAPRVALRAGVEQAAIAAVPLVLWGALRVLRTPGERVLAGMTAVAVPAALQLYPRPDFLHLMPVAPLLLPPAFGAARAALAQAALSERARRAVLVAVPLLLAAVRFTPTAALLADLARGRMVEVTAGDARLTIAPEGADRLRNLADAAGAVRQWTAAGDPVLGFPACAMVPFLAGRVGAGPHDYFFPGRPPRGEVAVLALQLGAERPPAAVTCSAAGTDLARAWQEYPELVGLIASRYVPRLERPPFTVYTAR
jgi:hypothetical protein